MGAEGAAGCIRNEPQQGYLLDLLFEHAVGVGVDLGNHAEFFSHHLESAQGIQVAADERGQPLYEKLARIALLASSVRVSADFGSLGKAASLEYLKRLKYVLLF